MKSKSKEKNLAVGSGSEIELGPIESRVDNIFGYGMNCITGRASSALCVGSVKKQSPQNTITNHLQVTVVKDTQSYQSFFSAAVSATASGLAWSGSGSISYAVTQTSSDTYMSYVAFCVMTSQTIYMDVTGASISKDALAMITSDPVNGPAGFINKYGTHCAVGVRYGGSFVGRIRFETSSASNKESIAASMSASASAFGVSGSINASFNSEIQSISTKYTLSSDSYIVGGSTSGFDRTNPDGMVSASQQVVLAHDKERGVDGSAIAFVCVPWDQFPEIQAALDQINQPYAFEFANAQSNIAQLSAEFTSLEYIVGTCNSMISGGTYAIPSYRATLSKMMQAAVSGESAIQALGIEQIGQLTPGELAKYLISAQMMPLLNAITHSQVLVQASWYLDAAFTTPGWFTATIAAPLSSNLTFVANADHRDGVATLSFHTGADNQGSYLVSRWSWGDDRNFDGNRVDIGTASFPTGTSIATWTGAAWNQIDAQLIDFNPSTFFARP